MMAKDAAQQVGNLLLEIVYKGRDADDAMLSVRSALVDARQIEPIKSDAEADAVLAAVLSKVSLVYDALGSLLATLLVNITTHPELVGSANLLNQLPKIPHSQGN